MNAAVLLTNSEMAGTASQRITAAARSLANACLSRNVPSAAYTSIMGMGFSFGEYDGRHSKVVLTSRGTAGCVVAGVAIDTDAGDSGEIDLVRSTFRSWTGLLAEQLRAVGVPSERAAPIAVATLAGMEGALILCRAEGNAKPLDTVAEELLRLLPPATSRPVP